MDIKTAEIVRRINQSSKARKYITILCIAFLLIGIFIFIFYGFNNPAQSIKFISNHNPINKNNIEKVMINPRIKFEYSDNEFYNISAKKAVNKDAEGAVLYDVYAVGNAGNIKSDKLVVTNNGDNLHFTGNPVLVINEANP